MRKTSSKVLLALFNAIGDIRGRSFLDLFSGSGQIAREAWARGARPVVAVEADKASCANLRSLCRDREGLEVVCMDVRRALPKLAKDGYEFSVIFADPPYEYGWIGWLLSSLSKYDLLLKPDGLLVLERSKREDLPLPLEGWNLCKERSYGDTVLSFLCRGEGSPKEEK